MDLTNKTICITGANGGVGAATLSYALKHNAKKIYALARDSASLEALAARHPSITALQLDITDAAQVASVAAELEPLDLLINTAGVNSGARIFDATQSDFDVNVFGTLNVYKAFTPKMQAGGAIVTVTSILACMNLPIMGLYCASKSALRSLTQALRAEVASKNIEVYEVLAGPIETKMTEGQEMPKSKPEAIVEAIFEEIEQKSFEIYPDDFSKMIREGLAHDPREVELNFAASLG
ncbi:MAG: SDR family NAD(P)-dependent oxidoreductase [Sulfurimonadaceae bacterium]